MLVAAHLRKRGYEVESALDGIEDLTSIETRAPDVVITDLVMPRLDGLGLLRELAQSHPELPAIVLTARETVDDVLCAIRQGILFDYLVKPPDLAIMEMAVRRAAEVRDLRTRAREADQVKAMRALAITAADRILNPCHIISLTLALLEQKGCPADAIAQAIPSIKAAVERIAHVVHQMSTVSRYTPSQVCRNFPEIDLDRASAPEPDGQDQPPYSAAPSPTRHPVKPE